MGDRLHLVNHASLLLHSGSKRLITDPWILSPAFGNWTQCPGPRDDDVRLISSGDPSDQLVLVSHGHDDHLDEFWLATHARDSVCVIPKLHNRGLFRRIERVSGRPPLEIPHGGLELGGFKFLSFQNPEFTDSDSIVLIQTAELNVIHANDNWHQYPEDIVQSLQEELSKNSDATSFYFVQFGIADCFPINHHPFTNTQRLEIITGRLNDAFNATRENATRLHCDFNFCYANQSTFESPAYWLEQSNLDFALELLRDNPGVFAQANPGMQIWPLQAVIQSDDSGDFYSTQLGRLETFINESLSLPIAVRLKTTSSFSQFANYDDHDTSASEYIELHASRLTWSRILIGELTLESILIGGLGMIVRPSEPISRIHRLLSSLSYSIQRRIRENGIFAFDR